MTYAIARILEGSSVWADLPAGAPAPAGRIAVRGDDGLPADLVRVPPGLGAADLEAAAARARLGLLLTHPRTTDDIGRTAAALAVAEARLDRPEESLGLAVLVGGADGLAAVLRLALPRRLIGLGLDTPALLAALGLDPDADSAPPLVVARGQVVLAAAALGLPAFERRRTAGPADAEAARAAGFTAVLAPPAVMVA